MAISTAIDNSEVARVVGIKTQYKNFRQGGIVNLPQRIALFGQGSSSATYSMDKFQITGATEAGQKYGFGSPIHLAALQLLPVNGDGVGSVPVTVYPLEDGLASAPSVCDITPAGVQIEAAIYLIRINGIDSGEFIIQVGDAVADIVAAITAVVNAAVDLPVTAVDGASKADLTSKWAGLSANGIKVEVIGSTSAGTTFTVTDSAGGLGSSDIADALNQVGDVWETMFLNCSSIDDSTLLDDFRDFGNGRWGALTKKPMAVFTGTNEADLATSIAITDARKTDQVNSILPAPGSVELPFVIAARQLARIAVVADSNPPKDYGSQKADGLIPGADSDQWNYLQRDAAVKAGHSTIEVKSGVVNVSDVVTCYHPVGDPLPAYRYVVDIVKLQNIIFNLNLIFEAEEWDGAPLLPDDQPTTNRSAKKPKMAKAAVSSLIDSLGLNAIISDPEAAKKNTVVQINDQNPKRLDIILAVQLSGNTNIISIDLLFGFYFGNADIVA